MRILAGDLLSTLALTGAILLSAQAELDQPPVVNSFPVARLREQGLTRLQDDRANLLLLDAAPRPQWLAVVEKNEGCRFEVFVWRSGGYRSAATGNCSGFNGGVQVALALNDNSHGKNSENFLLEPMLSYLKGWAVLVNENMGAHPPSSFEYIGFDGSALHTLPTISEIEGIERVVSIPGNKLPDLVISGNYFACHRLAPSYMSNYKYYSIYLGESKVWEGMNELQAPDGLTPYEQQLFAQAVLAFKDGNRTGAMEAMETLKKSRPDDPAVLRDYAYTDVTVEPCAGRLSPHPTKPSRIGDDERDTWTGSVLEGNGQELLTGLRGKSNPRIFTPGYGKQQFSPFDEDAWYPDCAFGTLMHAPDSFCLRDDPARWFLYGWALYQMEKGPDQYLPAFEKAVTLAPKDSFYRRVLAYAKAGRFPPPR